MSEARRPDFVCAETESDLHNFVQRRKINIGNVAKNGLRVLKGSHILVNNIKKKSMLVLDTNTGEIVTKIPFQFEASEDEVSKMCDIDKSLVANLTYFCQFDSVTELDDGRFICCYKLQKLMAHDVEKIFIWDPKTQTNTLLLVDNHLIHVKTINETIFAVIKGKKIKIYQSNAEQPEKLPECIGIFPEEKDVQYKNIAMISPSEFAVLFYYNITEERGYKIGLYKKNEKNEFLRTYLFEYIESYFLTSKIYYKFIYLPASQELVFIHPTNDFDPPAGKKDEIKNAQVIEIFDFKNNYKLERYVVDFKLDEYYKIFCMPDRRTFALYSSDRFMFFDLNENKKIDVNISKLPVDLREVHNLVFLSNGELMLWNCAWGELARKSGVSLNILIPKYLLAQLQEMQKSEIQDGIDLVTGSKTNKFPRGISKIIGGYVGGDFTYNTSRLFPCSPQKLMKTDLFSETEDKDSKVVKQFVR